MHRREDQARFEEHVQETKDKLAQLDQRMQTVDTRVTNSVAVRDVVIGEAMMRVDNLQTNINALQEHLTMRVLVEREQTTRESEDNLTSVDSAKAVVEELRRIREESERQIAQELEAIKAARIEAQMVAEAFRQAVQPAVNSSKRKRSDEDEGEHDNATVIHVESPPAPKRRRTIRVMSRIAQTATIATVGAVAAWTALAFS